MKAQIVCWHCGASKELEIDQPPQFAFEIAGFAQQVGMVGYSDMRRGRVLVFCSPEHAMAETTTTGAFRLRPKGIGHATAIRSSGRGEG